MALYHDEHPTATVINVVRLLFPSFVWLQGERLPISGIRTNLDVIEWLWVNSKEFYPEPSALKDFRTFLLGAMVAYYDIRMSYSQQLITRQIVALMDPIMLDGISKGSHTLLAKLFAYDTNPLCSFELGNTFINLVLKLDLDVQVFMAEEIKAWPEEAVKTEWRGPKKFIFERHHDQNWILGWEWSFDQQAPGYLVVSEYSVIAGDSWCCGAENILLDRSHTGLFPISKARFSRRLATHARKERARTGQKRPRSKIPGAWS